MLLDIINIGFKSFRRFSVKDMIPLDTRLIESRILTVIRGFIVLRSSTLSWLSVDAIIVSFPITCTEF